MTVYANGLEVSCKAQGNKVIAAFPDVCFTPPQTPATPPGVPVPYPTFGLDSEADKGTGTVKIGGKTITQKNVSYYTKTTGTEAGCAPKKGIVTSKNTGKEYAAAWSSDVKADGQPVARMSDLATVNHASPMGNAAGGKVGKVGRGGAPDRCEQLANELEDLICRNKHEHGGDGDHGFLMRLAEQICGKEGLGTPSFGTHQGELERTRTRLVDKIAEFRSAGCILDDYEFHKKRDEKDRTENIRATVDGIDSGAPAFSAQVDRARFLGRKNSLCKNLAADRMDKTLNSIFKIIGAG